MSPTSAGLTNTRRRRAAAALATSLCALALLTAASARQEGGGGEAARDCEKVACYEVGRVESCQGDNCLKAVAAEGCEEPPCFALRPVRKCEGGDCFRVYRVAKTLTPTTGGLAGSSTIFGGVSREPRTKTLRTLPARLIVRRVAKPADCDKVTCLEMKQVKGCKALPCFAADVKDRCEGPGCFAIRKP
jgi:hypothetical protein